MALQARLSRTFTASNQLVYLSEGMGAMMDRMRGFTGDRILVNGAPPAIRNVATRPYRLRVLNGSNARIYKLAWSDGRPVTVIGADGGLLETPEDKPYAALAPAQRLDIWVDLSDSRTGNTLKLISGSYDAGMMSGGMGMMGNSRLSVGSQFNLMTLKVTESVDTAETLPAQLAVKRKRIPVTNATRIRKFELSHVMMRGFAINGRQFNGATVADDEKVRLGDTEIWEFRNNTPMPHPMHVHGFQFNVIGRDNNSSDRSWGGLRQGLVDTGWHDTVLVLPGEAVRLAMTFERFDGLYIYHCHNMEHEDTGMMRYFQVQS
jgi:FtsP/CotA-like multicopper oxidase with cupredoxin domain